MRIKQRQKKGFTLLEKTNKQQSSLTGFILIELLISAAIFSVIVLSIYSAFQTGILSYNKLDSSFDLYQTARIVFNKIEHDLRNSFPYFEKDSKFKAGKQQLDFFSRLDSINSQAEVYSEICRIIYKLDGDVLKRACCKGMDALEDVSKLDIQADDLAGQVKEISFDYAFAVRNNSEKCYDWQDIWPQENDKDQEKSLPLAVRITLVLREVNIRSKQQENNVEFIKIIPLPVGKLS